MQYDSNYGKKSFTQNKHMGVCQTVLQRQLIKECGFSLAGHWSVK